MTSLINVTDKLYETRQSVIDIADVHTEGKVSLVHMTRK